jgi:hypothetical protein
MMGAASTSEMLVNFYQTTQHYNPEDSHLHSNSFVSAINKHQEKSGMLSRCTLFEYTFPFQSNIPKYEIHEKYVNI